MKKVLSIFALGIIVFFSACKKEVVTPVENTDKSMRELNVNPGFDWKTTHSVTLTLTGYAASTVEVKTPEGDLIQKVLLKKGEAIKSVLALPKATKSIQLRYMGQEVNLEVSGTDLSYIFN